MVPLLLTVLKVVGIVLAILIPGGFVLMALFIKFGPRVLRALMDRME